MGVGCSGRGQYLWAWAWAWVSGGVGVALDRVVEPQQPQGVQALAVDRVRVASRGGIGSQSGTPGQLAVSDGLAK